VSYRKIDALKEIIRAWGLNPEEIDARSPNEAAHDYNRPKPTGKPAALTANNSIATTDAKRNPRKSTRKKYEFTPGTK
jgi:hypothetical protein